MKDMWKWVVSGIGAALAVFAGVLAVLLFRGQKQKLAGRIKDFADQEADLAEERAAQEAREAEEKLVQEWKQFQEETREKVQDEASSISDDELFARLRNPNG